MTILLFTLAAILTGRIVYLFATNRFEEILKQCVLGNYRGAYTIFTFLEAILIGLTLATGDHKLISFMYIYMAHNILFAIIPIENMIAKKGLRYLFLSINGVIFLLLTIIYAYKLWIGIQ